MNKEEIFLRMILGNQSYIMTAIAALIENPNIRKVLNDKAQETAKLAASGIPKE